jgi:peptidoglycan/LPS O-acetylase OafA/YrhL
MLLLTVLLGFFVYNGTIPYFENKEVFTYVPRNLFLLDMQYSITGIFESNPYKSAINGSLWTICYEFLFYILLPALIVCRKNIKAIRLLLALAFVIAVLINIFFITLAKHVAIFGLMGNYVVLFGTFLIAGALLAAIDIQQIKNKSTIVLFLLAVASVCVYFDVFDAIQYLVLPVVIILIGLQSTKYINSINSWIGDVSYGTYIYGFPVQQTLMYYFKLDQVTLCFYSIVISLIFGFLSWHLIEKNALKLKTKIVHS